MTFYQELKEFFKNNDPQRLYMANKIARKFRLGTEQKVVLNRLKVIYETGGPSEIVLTPPVLDTPAIENVESEVMDESVDGAVEEQASVEVEIDIEGESPEITIETPDDEEKES